MTKKQSTKEEPSGSGALVNSRRAAMKKLVWAAPAIVATAALQARAATPTGGDTGDGDTCLPG